MTSEILFDIGQQVAKALRSYGAEPRQVKVEPIRYTGLRIEATIYDQTVAILILPGQTVAWEDLADSLVEQLDPVNVGRWGLHH